MQLTKWLKGLTRKSMLAAALATLLLAPLAPIAAAESATAIPHLDRARFLGSWFQIAAIPTKTQKVCLRNTRTEYALADGANSFQTGTFCRLKSNNGDWESNGRFDKHDSGRLKLIRLWPFTSKYWVLATAPDYAWMLVGTPNHKSLWILSKTPDLAPEQLTDIRAQATRQGFNTSKLVPYPQHVEK